MQKTKVLILADKRGWAYDKCAQAIKARLSDEFEFGIVYVAENPLTAATMFDCDLLHVCWWGEDWHRQLNLPTERVIKELSSFRWREEEKFGRLDPASFVKRYLSDAGSLIATSRKMEAMIQPMRPVCYAPNGFEPAVFFPQTERDGPIKIGWAGNIDDACKGIKDIIAPACNGDYQLLVAPGNIKSTDDMRRFYNGVDAFCVASTAEGSPLPLLEALACGCFVVCTDVGVVPEVVRHKDNGLVVNRSIAAFRAAFTWCDSNLDYLRQTASQRANDIAAIRNWDQTALFWRDAYRQAELALVRRGAA